MSFSAEWLSLREPADVAARDSGLLEEVAAWAAARPGLLVADIGAGSGSTLRTLAPRLPGARWRLLDLDPDLLALAAASAAAMGVDASTERRDLAADPKPPAGAALVTASAFFDLAGAAWIDDFAAACAAAGCAVYAALNYDGLEIWAPPHPEDETVLATFLRDMARDKGLGPAVGPRGGAALAESLAARGYTVRTAESPWRLQAPRDAALIAALAGGVADAGGASAGWRAARMTAQAVTVGHIDVWATPA